MLSRLTPKQRWIAGAVLLACALWGLKVWRSSRAAPPVHFETASSDRGRIVAKVTATGTVSALVTVPFVFME